MLIALFFCWHVFAVGVGGISNTLGAQFATTLRHNVYDNIKWYHTAIQQNQQNWGFFSFVPGEIVRISFATWNPDTQAYEEFDEYRLTEPPFVGRHNMFNFVRGIAEADEHYNEIRGRYIQWWCEHNDVSDKTIYMRKKTAPLPKEELMQYYDWNTFKPDWKYHTIAEAYCPPVK